MTSRERRAPRARPPQSNSNSASASPAPSAPPPPMRRKQDDDEPVDDKPRNKRLPKDKDLHKGKSKLVEEISSLAPYTTHDDDEEGSVTRCVCGSDEEDMGNFMIQCEQCSVWQHGVCMGVANVDESPEHYYCEMCKPENHAGLLRDLKRGRVKMSPIVVPHPALPPRTSRSTSPGLAKTPKSPKRRNTMNSRDAAYDEAQAFQLTIQTEPEPEPEPTKRKRKRTGDVEEDDILKRKRATMSPMSTTSERPVAVVAETPVPVPAPPKPDPPAGRVTKRRKDKDVDMDGKPKHPNQYTYRGTKAAPASRRPAANNDSAPYPSGSTRRTAAAAAAAAERGPSPSPLPTTWALPDHLSHLADLLPTPLPRGVPVRTGAGTELQIEKNAKIRWPGKRTTIGDMRKRVRGMLEWVGRAQAEATDRAKRVEELERARRENEAAARRDEVVEPTISPSGSSAISSLPPTGSMVPVKLPDVAQSGTPAVSTLQLLESLTRDLLGFQDRFNDGGRLNERERRGRGGDID